jgi:di/tricarboxylate transporter
MMKESESEEDREKTQDGFPKRIVLLTCAVIVLAFVSRQLEHPESRGGLLLLGFVAVNLSGVLPVYCTALLVPLLATLLRVLPNRTPGDTARACFASMMNTMTAIILGSFTTNAIFMKCRLDQRFLNYVALRFGGRPELFFLMLLLGCMYCSALTIITLVALAAVQPLCEKETTDRKALVIGIGISCTLGSVLTPISGTASLITLSVLSEFGHRVYFLYWMLIAIPVCTVVCTMTAGILLRLYGTPAVLEQPTETLQALQRAEYWQMGAAAVFILGCMAGPWVEPVIGDPGNLGLALTALAFGSGSLSREDFRRMPWDILAMLLGVNVLSFVLKESGLARELADYAAPGQLYGRMLWTQFAQFTAGAAIAASCAGQALAATLVIPVVVAVGTKLYCPVLLATLVCISIAFGVGTPYSSQDLIMLVDLTDRRGRPFAQRADYVRAGCIITVIGYIVNMSVGYGLGMAVLGTPPVQIIVQEPKALVPSMELMKDSEEDTELRYLDPEKYLEKKLREVDADSPYVKEREEEDEDEESRRRDESRKGERLTKIGRQTGPGAVPIVTEVVVEGGTVGPHTSPEQSLTNATEDVAEDEDAESDEEREEDAGADRNATAAWEGGNSTSWGTAVTPVSDEERALFRTTLGDHEAEAPRSYRAERVVVHHAPHHHASMRGARRVHHA